MPHVSKEKYTLVLFFDYNNAEFHFIIFYNCSTTGVEQGIGTWPWVIRYSNIVMYMFPPKKYRFARFMLKIMQNYNTFLWRNPSFSTTTQLSIETCSTLGFQLKNCLRQHIHTLIYIKHNKRMHHYSFYQTRNNGIFAPLRLSKL